MSLNLPDTYADKRIKVSIRNNRSFAVIAGAGSGKTTSLIKALDFVRSINGNKLSAMSQRVACITFTNRAVEVIKSRLNSDDLFLVTTLHSFLWAEIKSFSTEIRSMLKSDLIPKRIEKKREDDNGGTSKKALDARKRIEELNLDLSKLDSVTKFSYDESGTRNYSNGQLDHDDVIDLASLMITKLPVLRKIIGQKYPFIFVDEAQDTFPGVVDSLNLISNQISLPLVGYFGDPMQQIYDDRAGNFCGPTGSLTIKKSENFRCSTEVINLLNSFRKDIQQVPSSRNATGSVRLVLVKSEEGLGPRKTYTDSQLQSALQKFDSAVNLLGWQGDNEVKRLFLARQMIARRLGFTKLNQLFNGDFASRGAKEDYESGQSYLLAPFVKVVVPVIVAMAKGNKAMAFQVLKSHSPLLNPHGESEQKKVSDVVSNANTAITQLVDAWPAMTSKEILVLAGRSKLIAFSERLEVQLQRQPRIEEYDKDVHEREKGDWLADEFFKMGTEELESYVKFINDETPFSTQHGVKGEEYKKVLVFYDDTEANWNIYSFSKLLTPKAVGKDPTDGQKEKSQKLAYVAFSRAEVDLGIVLFTPNPEASKIELRELGFFKDSQISIC